MKHISDPRKVLGGPLNIQDLKQFTFGFRRSEQELKSLTIRYSYFQL